MATDIEQRIARHRVHIERVRAWEQVKTRIRVIADDWPEALTVGEIAFLYAFRDGRPDWGEEELFRTLLDDLVYHWEPGDSKGLPTVEVMRNERPPVRALGASDLDAAEQVTVRRTVVRAQDAARVLGGENLPPALRAWLAPYLQAAKPKSPAETHQDEVAPVASEMLTPMKRKGVIERFGRKYQALESALNRPEAWAKACRVPKEASPDGKNGWYYLERIESECRARYGGTASASAPAADWSAAGQLRVVGK